MCFPKDYPKNIFACLRNEGDLKDYKFDLLKTWNRLMSTDIMASNELGVSEIKVGPHTFYVGSYYTGHKPDSKAVQLRRVPGNTDSYFKPPRLLANGKQCMILSLQKGQEGSWFAWVQPLSREPDVTAPLAEPPANRNDGGYVPLEELQPFW